MRKRGFRGVDAPRSAIEAALSALDCYYQDAPAWFVGSRVAGGHRPGSDLDVVVGRETGRLKNPDGNTGLGMTLVDEESDLMVDITEDLDGPVRGEGHAEVRIR